METRLRDTTHQLMKALEAFYPFVKNAEERISMLEGDLANLSEKKKNLEIELNGKIKEADGLIAADKKRVQDKLDTATLLCDQAQELYFELYRAKVTKILPPSSFVEEKIVPKIKDVASKVKEAKEKSIA